MFPARFGGSDRVEFCVIVLDNRPLFVHSAGYCSKIPGNAGNAAHSTQGFVEDDRGLCDVFGFWGRPV